MRVRPACCDRIRGNGSNASYELLVANLHQYQRSPGSSEDSKRIAWALHVRRLAYSGLQREHAHSFVQAALLTTVCPFAYRWRALRSSARSAVGCKNGGPSAHFEGTKCFGMSPEAVTFKLCLVSDWGSRSERGNQYDTISGTSAGELRQICKSAGQGECQGTRKTNCKSVAYLRSV